MKRLCSIIAAILLAVSCQQPVVELPKVQAPNIHIVNSRWYVVKEATVTGRAIESTEALEAEVAAYNAANTDDQWTLIEGDVPPIENSPLANVWMVYPDTYEVYYEQLGMDRQLVRDNYDSWRQGVASQGYVLFVDRIPPAPLPPPEPPTDFEKYAIYVFDADGVLQYENHCEDWAAHQAPSIEFWFYQLSTAWEGQIQLDGLGWTMIKGRLWEPEPDPVEEIPLTM